MANDRTVKYVSVAAVVVLLVFVIGMFVFRDNNTVQADVIYPEVLLQNVPYDVKVYLDPFYPKVGDTIRGKMEIRVDDELVNVEEYGVLSHVTVVSDNVADLAFYHATEELIQTSPGIYEFEHTLKESSPYTLWIEMNNNTGREHHTTRSDYVARIALGVDGAQTQPAKAEARTEYIHNDEYRVRLVSEKIVAGQPQQLHVQVETLDGQSVPLLDNFDHYYVVTAPQHSMYLLDHPDHERSTTQEIYTSPVYFPAAGQYGFWIRLFAANEDGSIRDYLDGNFVVDVVASDA